MINRLITFRNGQRSARSVKEHTKWDEGAMRKYKPCAVA